MAPPPSRRQIGSYLLLPLLLYLIPLSLSSSPARLAFQQPSIAREGCSRYFGPRRSATAGNQELYKGEWQQQQNPQATSEQTSKSGVKYSSVLEGLYELYPPEELEKRNAESRSDGYWPFIQIGKEPPKQFTYGEFDFFFFAQLLDRAKEHHHPPQDNDNSSWEDKVFVDIGSGTGRLVVAASALHPGWKLCRGIEVLPGIHQVAQEIFRKCIMNDEEDSEESQNNDEPTASYRLFETGGMSDDEWLDRFKGKFVLDESASTTNEEEEEEENIEDDELWLPVGGSSMENAGLLNTLKTSAVHKEANRNDVSSLKQDDGIVLPSPDEQICFLPNVDLKMAPVELVCGSFEEVYFGDADCVFVFSSCMSSTTMKSLSDAIGKQCKPGTIAITTEFPLHLEEDGYKMDIIETIDGYCWLTGGESTAYLHRVVKSMHKENNKSTVQRRHQQMESLSREDRAYQTIVSQQQSGDDGMPRDHGVWSEGEDNDGSDVASFLDPSWLPRKFPPV